jgi:hypothetical protein
MGILAAAGAVAGGANAVTEIARDQIKLQNQMSLEQRVNDLATQRESTIERLRAADEASRQGTQIQAEKERTQQEIAGHSAVAQFERGSIASENQKNRDAAAALAKNHGDVQKTIAQGHDKARVDAANARVAGKPIPEWKPGEAPLQVTSKFGGAAPKASVLVHRDGSRWVQDPSGKLFPFDPSKPNGYNPTPTNRAAPDPADVSTLLSNPNGMLPSGTTTRDYFVGKYGSLPPGYLGSSQADRAKNPIMDYSGSSGGGDGAPPVAEQEDPSESEPPPTLPPSQ